MATSHVYPNIAPELPRARDLSRRPPRVRVDHVDDPASASRTRSTTTGRRTNFTDDKPRGTPLPCARARVDVARRPAGLKTGAPIIDCVNGELDGKAQPLIVVASG